MILHEVMQALKCYVGIHENGKVNCFNCKAKRFCDDVTLVAVKHTTEKREKTDAEKQEELLR